MYVCVFVGACTYVRLGILEMSLCVYCYVVVEGMCLCNTKHFSNDNMCVFLLFFKRVCTHVRMGISKTTIFVHVSVVLESINTYKTGNDCNKPLRLCLCCCRVYVYM